MNRRIARFLCCAVVAAGLSGGCRSKPKSVAPSTPHPLPIPVLGRVVVEDMTPDSQRPKGVAFDVDALAGRAVGTLRSAGVFVPPPANDAGAPGSVAQVLIGFTVELAAAGPRAAAHALVKLRVGVHPRGSADSYWNEDVEAVGEIPFEKPQDNDRVFESLVGRMINDILAEYLARLHLHLGSEQDILAALDAKNTDVQEEAIRLAGERGMKRAVDRLLVLLDNDDERIRDAALGALLSLRERRAIAALGKSRSMKDRREMGKILEAIALLGGDEAESYLQFVADAHEDEEIKAQARAALMRLKRREPGITPR